MGDLGGVLFPYGHRCVFEHVFTRVVVVSIKDFDLCYIYRYWTTVFILRPIRMLPYDKSLFFLTWRLYTIWSLSSLRVCNTHSRVLLLPFSLRFPMCCTKVKILYRPRSTHIKYSDFSFDPPKGPDPTPWILTDLYPYSLEDPYDLYRILTKHLYQPVQTPKWFFSDVTGEKFLYV